MTHYDFIIVGGGSAGSVLANRLSARSANQVLICEAGQDTPHGAVPEVILDSYPGKAYLDPRFHWNDLKVTTEAFSHNAPDSERPPLRKYEQARVLGGGSSINGQLANRGAPTDYNEWEERGASGWNWDAVLPYFKKVERDMDFDGPFHGKEGRIPVRRVFSDQWNGYSKAVAEALERKGYKYLRDQNGAFEEGYFPITMSNALSDGLGGDRISRSRDAPARQPHDFDRNASHRVAFRRTALHRRQGACGRQGAGVSRQSSHSVFRRYPFAGASDARGYRTRHPARRARGHGAAQSGWRRPAADGSPGDCGRVIPASTCPAQRIFAAAHSDGLPVLVQDWRRARGRHVRRCLRKIVLARGWRADRHAADLRQ